MMAIYSQKYGENLWHLMTLQKMDGLRWLIPRTYQFLGPLVPNGLWAFGNDFPRQVGLKESPISSSSFHIYKFPY